MIKSDPSLVEKIFFKDDVGARAKLGIADADVGGVDYRSLSDGLVAMAEATGEEIDEDDPVGGDLGVSGELGFDAGYGLAFFVDPKGLKQAKNSMVCHMDDEIGAAINAAAKNGDYLVGIIS